MLHVTEYQVEIPYSRNYGRFLEQVAEAQEMICLLKLFRWERRVDSSDFQGSEYIKNIGYEETKYFSQAKLTKDQGVQNHLKDDFGLTFESSEENACMFPCITCPDRLLFARICSRSVVRAFMAENICTVFVY